MRNKYITVQLLNRVFYNNLCSAGKDIIEIFKKNKVFLNDRLEIRNIDEIKKGKKFILKQFVGVYRIKCLDIYYHAILQCINRDIADEYFDFIIWQFTSSGALTKLFNKLYKKALDNVMNN